MTTLTDPFTVPDVKSYESPEDATQEIPTVDGPVRLTPDQMAEKTDEFPYGRRADGSPRAKPGPRSNGGPRPVAAPRARKAARTPAKKNEPDYRPGIMGMAQIPIMLLTFLGRQTGRKPLQADDMTLAHGMPPMAEALNNTAKHHAGLAGVLDRALKAGPFGEIIAAAVPIAMQLAANHGLIPANPQMGIYSVDELCAASDQQLSDMAAAAGAA